MKLLYLLTQDLHSPSGLGRYMPLARELAALGHQVSIAALHPSFHTLPDKHFDLDGVKVSYVAPMHVIKEGSHKRYYSTPALLRVAAVAALRLGQAARAAGADIIHIGKPHPMNSMAALYTRRMSNEQNKPRLFLDCDDDEAGSNRFSGAWQRRVLNWFETRMPAQVERVTTNTLATRARLLQQGLSAERIFYLPNGVDRRRFAGVDPGQVESLRSQLNLGSARVVAFIGSLSLTTHPVDLLLEAFCRVRAFAPDAVLLLVGGGEDFNRLQAMAGQMGLGGSVRFVGRVPPEDVPAYYRLARASVDPVRDDAAARARSPLKLFESWASGAPFVSADVGDRRRLVGDPPAGLLAAPGDPDALAEAMLSVLFNDALAEALTRRGLARVQSYYWDQLARRMEAEYLRQEP